MASTIKVDTIVNAAGSGGPAFTNGIIGVTTSSDAAAGYVGEYLENIRTAFTNLTTGQYFDIAQITLSAGDWDVVGDVQFSRNGATISPTLDTLSAITGTAGNSGTGIVVGNFVESDTNNNLTFSSFHMTTQRVRVKSDGTNLSIRGVSTVGQIVYLKALIATVTAGTAQGRGALTARRVR